MLSPDTVLNGRYQIKRRLGHGGQGAVYEANALHLNTFVAVKEAFFSEDSLRQQFEQEARTLARLRHSAMPYGIDYFSENGSQFLVMDLITGDDLDSVLKNQLKEHGEPFDWRIVVEWADRLLDALDYLHHLSPPIIHRDIKPQNLKLRTEDGNLFLIDFGLAKNGATPSRPGESIVRGNTPNYSPPEQVNDLGTDLRSDLYALGATLYHLLTGRLPDKAERREDRTRFGAPDPLLSADQANPKVPSEISTIVAKAMSLDPNQRYVDAKAMREALKTVRRHLQMETEHKQRDTESRYLAKQAPVLKELPRRREGLFVLVLKELSRRREESRHPVEHKYQAEKERQHQAGGVRQRELDRQRREQEWLAQDEETRLRKVVAPPRSSRQMIASAVLLLLLLASIVFFIYWLWPHEPPPKSESTASSPSASPDRVEVLRYSLDWKKTPGQPDEGFRLHLQRFSIACDPEPGLHRRDAESGEETQRVCKGSAFPRRSLLLCGGGRTQLKTAVMPRSSGYLYLIGFDKGMRPQAYLNKQRIGGGGEFLSERWAIAPGKSTARFTVILASNPLVELPFLNEKERELRDDEWLRLQNLRQRYARTAPELSGKPSDKAVTAQWLPGEPLIFEIVVSRRASRN